MASRVKYRKEREVAEGKEKTMECGTRTSLTGSRFDGFLVRRSVRLLGSAPDHVHQQNSCPRFPWPLLAGELLIFKQLTSTRPSAAAKVLSFNYGCSLISSSAAPPFGFLFVWRNTYRGPSCRYAETRYNELARFPM